MADGAGPSTNTTPEERNEANQDTKTYEESKGDNEWLGIADDTFTQDFKDTDNFDVELFKEEFTEFNDRYKNAYGEDWVDSSNSEGEYGSTIPSNGYIDRIMNGGATESAMPGESDIKSPDLQGDRPSGLEHKVDGGDAKFDKAAMENFCDQLRKIKADHLADIPDTVLHRDEIWINPGDFHHAHNLGRKVNGEEREQAGLSDATRNFVNKLNDIITTIDEKLHTTMNHYEKAEEFQEMTTQELEALMEGTNGKIEALGEGVYASEAPQ